MVHLAEEAVDVKVLHVQDLGETRGRE